MMSSQKALFLDRDGTLIIDKDYLSDPAQVVILPGVVDGLKHALDLGYKLFLFSNQSGIGRGYYTLAEALKVNERMEELIGLARPLFSSVCMPPERPDHPMNYRKPSPKFILETIQTFQLDPAGCIMVGDRQSDVAAGLNAQIKVAALCTGQLNTAQWAALAIPGLPVYADFAAFSATL